MMRAGVEVVEESLALTEKFRSENDIVATVLLSYILRVAHRNGAFDDHDGVWIHLHHQLDDFLNMGRVEVIFYRVVVCWSGNDDEVGVLIGFFSIGCGLELECLFCQILLYVFVLNG